MIATIALNQCICDVCFDLPICHCVITLRTQCDNSLNCQCKMCRTLVQQTVLETISLDRMSLDQYLKHTQVHVVTLNYDRTPKITRVVSSRKLKCSQVGLKVLKSIDWHLISKESMRETLRVSGNDSAPNRQYKALVHMLRLRWVGG